MESHEKEFREKLREYYSSDEIINQKIKETVDRMKGLINDESAMYILIKEKDEKYSCKDSPVGQSEWIEFRVLIKSFTQKAVQVQIGGQGDHKWVPRSLIENGSQEFHWGTYCNIKIKKWFVDKNLR